MQDSELAILLPERERTKRNPFFHSSRPTSTNERLQKHGGTVATLSIRPASFNPSSSRWITDNKIASAIPNNWAWTMRVFLVAAEHGLLRLCNYRGYTTNQQAVDAGFLAMSCTTHDITVTQETTVACVDNAQRIFCIESGRIEEDGRGRTRRESNE